VRLRLIRPFHTRDILITQGLCLATFALYVVTLQPDFGGPEDAPKFQFLGYVLGTAHPPGYPLYALLSHLFVMLPIRTIAYRANLFSAVMAALACGIAYAIARQIGSTRWSGACAALALATGASFWRNALFAEVYSLAAVMVALTIVLLLAWSATGRVAWLLVAIAAFGLGFGNHLTIIGLIPAAILFVLWRDRRALTFRVMVVATVILMLCVSQYGFIILRTRQQALYLESSARSLSELLRVMTAQRFAEQRFAFSPAVVVTVQLPVVLSVIGRELGILGVLFLAAGLATVARRRNAAAGLVLGAALGLLVMVVNLSGDLKGFITPIVVLLWPLVALGADAVRQIESPRLVRLCLAVLAAAAMALVPVTNVRANYSEVDRSDQTEEGRLFRSLYAQLPDRSAIVAEDYFFDMALIYYMVTGEGGPNRGVGPIVFNDGVVRQAAKSGHRVFAFGRAASFFGAHGLSFERAAIVGPSLSEWLNGLPRGTVIAGAAAYSAVPFELSAIDHRIMSSVGTHPFTVFALATQRSSRVMRQADEGLSLPVDSGTIATSAPPFLGAVIASADEGGARVEFAGRTIATVDRGLVLAVFRADGTFWRTLEFRFGDPLRVEPEAAVYEFKAEAPCAEITTDKWTDVAPVLSTGSWLATTPIIGTVAIESELPESCAAPGVRVDEMLGGGAARPVSRTPNADGTVVLVTELTRTIYGRPLFRMALDCPASQARARVWSGGVESTVTLCGHRPPPLFPAGAERAVIRPDFESEAYFGSGWHDAERTPTGRVRRADGVATLLLPLTTGYSYRIALDLTAPPPTRIDAALNGAIVGGCELGDRTSCDLTVSSKLVRDGTNALTLTAARLRASDVPSFTFQGARIQRRLERYPQ
jgi:hypothetical protein